MRLVDGEDLVKRIKDSRAEDVAQEHIKMSRGKVASPSELGRDVAVRLRLTRGLPYLAAFAAVLGIHYASLFGAVGGSSGLLLASWLLVPAAAYVYTVAVPEASLSPKKYAALALFPFVFGPFFLHSEF